MLRFWISLLLVLFAAPTLASDWSHNNRIKPGENRSYEFTALDDSAMLDARACATTVFSWDQDITGSQLTGEGTLYSCPQVDSATAQCTIVSQLKDYETAMAVSEKPGFFFLDTTTAATGTAISRLTAFCAREFVRSPNYVRKVQLHDAVLGFGPAVEIPFSAGNFTRGYFVIQTTGTTGGASTVVKIENGATGDEWTMCLSNTITSDTDQIMLFGGEGYESGNGVNTDCNRALSRDLILDINVSVGGSMGVEIWFYGIPH